MRLGVVREQCVGSENIELVVLQALQVLLSRAVAIREVIAVPTELAESFQGLDLRHPWSP